MAEPRRIPGEAGIWVLIGGEMLVFSLFFLIFAYYRSQQPEVFSQSHLMLDRGIGLANTLVLLTSSLFVALGVRRVREGQPGDGTFFRAGLACGAIFAALKAAEYTAKFSHGITPLTNDFFMYYFAFTGIHLVHVLIGSGGLAYLSFVASREPSPSRTMLAECAGLFWHLVDLLWIMLFALFYLAGGSHG
ncbi:MULTISPECIES: cytochrome c oxidase subunit 3 [unclassified Novosphingobium]|uniref:cytochrome c oxidase subunit 3 n=1 Tax=unclassified Novosphingobium TaxID=2644732 RepID=UPI001F340A4A|nr:MULTISPECIES: cytochrome c oxidase subunit 3 [unclassified Novosphingobium]